MESSGSLTLEGWDWVGYDLVEPTWYVNGRKNGFIYYGRGASLEEALESLKSLQEGREAR